ncbi:uncharacterized protein METZ01_LOCUS229854, partial [marine metagenome]
VELDGEKLDYIIVPLPNVWRWRD